MLAMFWIMLWPVWVVRGAYRIDTRLGHVTLGVVGAMLLVYTISGH